VEKREWFEKQKRCEKHSLPILGGILVMDDEDRLCAADDWMDTRCAQQ